MPTQFSHKTATWQQVAPNTQHPMSNREEEIKTAIVADETIVFVSSELNRAAEYASQQLHQFIQFVKNIDPELTEAEAMILGGSVIENLPQLFRDNPATIDSLKSGAAFLRSKRSVK